MHPLRHIAELCHQAAAHFECRAQSAPASADLAVLAHIQRSIDIMSDNIAQLNAGVADLKARLQAAEQRDTARTDAMAGLKAQVTAQSEQLTALQAQLADLPHDTSAQEAALASVVASLQEVASGLDTIAADPAPQPTTAAPAPETTTEPAPVTTAPAETDPAAPTNAAT